MKVKSILLTFVSITILFSGCSRGVLKGNTEISGQRESLANTVNNVKKVELNFWTYPRWKGIKGTEQDGQEGDWERYVINNFHTENPEVTVKLNTLDYNSGPQKVNVAIASGQQPDILRDYPGRHLDYAQRGLLLPLDSYISDEEKEQYVDGVLEQCKGIDGKQYMIPWGITGKFMLVNRDLFKMAGAENLLPANKDRTWTYEQFSTALKAVSNPAEGIYGCALYAGNEQADNGMVALFENFGVNLIDFDQKGRPFSVVNSAKGVEAASFLRSLAKNQLAMPEAEALKAADCEKLFAIGKIAVLIHGSAKSASIIKTLMDQGKVSKFDMFPVMYPNADGVKPHNFCEIDTYAVFKSGDDEREKSAVDFCKYITSKRYINDIKPSLNLPAYKYADELYKGDEFIEYAKSTLYFNKDYYNNVKGFWRIRQTLYPAFQELFALPQKTQKQVLDDLASKIKNILNEYY